MNLKKFSFIALSISLVIATPVSADLGNLKKFATGDKAGTSDVYAAQSGLVSNFKASAEAIGEAQFHLANAFKLNELAAKIDAQNKALSSGSVDSKQSLEVMKTSGTELESYLSQSKADGVVLDEESKSHYTRAILPYVLGMVAAGEMAKTAPNFLESAQSTISSASFTKKLSVTKDLYEGVWLAKEIPGYSTNLLDTTKLILTFAKSNNVEIPEDATKAIGNLF